MSWDNVKHTRRGDVYGDPTPGHKVDVIHAAVLIQADGSEGLVSSYTFNPATGAPTGRVTLVTSDPRMLVLMRQMLEHLEPPPGGRFEWRKYRHDQ